MRVSGALYLLVAFLLGSASVHILHQIIGPGAIAGSSAIPRRFGRDGTGEHNAAPGGQVASPADLKTQSGVSRKQLLVFIGVYSAPKNRAKREAMRQTWLSTVAKEPLVEFRFVVGNSSKPQDQRALAEEQQRYGDLLRLPVVENYRNLTLKTLEFQSHAGLRFGSAVDFIVKCDDDVYAHVPTLVKTLQSLKAKTKGEPVYSGGMTSLAMYTNKGARHYEPHYKDFGGHLRYPPFAVGPFYIVSWHVSRYVAQNKDLLKLYGNEDAAIGLWTLPLRVRRMSMPGYGSSCRSNTAVVSGITRKTMQELHQSFESCGRCKCTK